MINRKKRLRAVAAYVNWGFDVAPEARCSGGPDAADNTVSPEHSLVPKTGRRLCHQCRRSGNGQALPLDPCGPTTAAATKLSFNRRTAAEDHLPASGADSCPAPDGPDRDQVGVRQHVVRIESSGKSGPGRGRQFVIRTFTVATSAESKVETAVSVMGTGAGRKKADDVSKAMREELKAVSVMVTPW